MITAWFTPPPSKADRLDARVLVARVGDAVVDELRSSLIEGYSPVDGRPRRTNSKGRPEGYRTGTLANGLRRGGVFGGQTKATTKVVPPASRAGWVASREDVLVANGRVAKRVEKTVFIFLEMALKGAEPMKAFSR